MGIKQVLNNKITIGAICFFAGALVMSTGSSETTDISKYEDKIKELEEIIQTGNIENQEVQQADTSVKDDVDTSKKNNETLVFEDDNVSIFFSKVSQDGVEFLVENKMDIQLTFQADSVAINGFSTNDITMSDPVSAKSKGKVKMRCDTSDFEKNIEKISGTLRVIDFENSIETYNANFVDVEIK